MTLALILFLISAVGIAFMLIKRISLIHEQELLIDHTLPIVPDIKEVRYIAIRKTKRFSIIVIAVILRSSIRTSLFVKQKSKEFSNKFFKQVDTIKHKVYHPKHPENIQKENNFLKAVSDYKSKIKKLKKQIIEEETRVE